MTSVATPQRPYLSTLADRYGFSSEQQLILLVARVNLTARDVVDLQSLVAKDIDWEGVLAETLRQCLVPLLYRNLQAHCATLVPADILAQLRNHYLLASARSLALAAELREITILLEANGVPCLPYKGPVLALQAYADIALRTFTDLDLIVATGDVARARTILSGRGYSPLEDLTSFQETAILRLDHNLPLLREEGRIIVELHWRVAPVAVTFGMPTRLLWDRSTLVSLGGQDVRAMAASDLILVLSVHGARHAWSAVEWITGIAELIRTSDEISWDQVIREAEEFRVARSVRLALALAHRLLDAPLPDRVRGWVHDDSRIARLVAWVASRLFVPSVAEGPPEQWAAFKFEMAVKDRLSDRTRDGWCRLFLPTSKDWSALGLPDLLFPLYFLIRPLRLMKRFLTIRTALPGRVRRPQALSADGNGEDRLP